MSTDACKRELVEAAVPLSRWLDELKFFWLNGLDCFCICFVSDDDDQFDCLTMDGSYIENAKKEWCIRHMQGSRKEDMLFDEAEQMLKVAVDEANLEENFKEEMEEALRVE